MTMQAIMPMRVMIEATMLVPMMMQVMMQAMGDDDVHDIVS
jgi:hypothetical protein